MFQFNFLSFTDICSSAWRNITIGDTTSITSPDYPANYPNNADCVCHLQSVDEVGGYFKINILQLNLEANYDFLTLGYGSEETDDSTVVTLTHASSPNSIYVFDSIMWTRFTSDRSSTRSGFVIQIEITLNNRTGIYLYIHTIHVFSLFLICY